MRSLLMFCYILFVTFCISCGEANSRQEGNDTATEGNSVKDPEIKSKKILFFGNSLTAGMGLDPNEAFPAVIQRKLDSLELPYEVINAGLSGETTAAGKSRIAWVLNQKIDIFVLELGANDGLRGIPLDETRKNLQEIIDVVRQKNGETKIILTGMQMPPNMGDDYTTTFRTLFSDLAKKNDIFLVPFLLERVGGIPDLNQQDGIHPTAEGQEILADNVWRVLEPLVIGE